jgi:hypothetical protein
MRSNGVIDPEAEEILPLTDAAKYVARTFGGRRPHINTLSRWCLQGLRGKKLESLKRGAQRVTSKQAVIRFFQVTADVKNERHIDDERSRCVEAALILEGL